MSNILYFEAGLFDHLRCPARSQEPYILLDQTLGEIQKTCLVINGDDG
jgi:hypothetical protein